MNPTEHSALEHYIYWKTSDTLRACHAVQQFQEALRLSLPGLHARVLWRAPSVPDNATTAAGAADHGKVGGTVLEIYARPQGLETEALQFIETVASAALRGLQDGPRHRERFTAFEDAALGAAQPR